ncbi:hypothetical protein ABZZ47_26215, partial [Streptomyces sp. NPDC006465]|uniref:hypothetical protein n=1 Tax=Streptomyces sp. NPDC006465 TaxID=3157174 RepID=UPI0033B1903B
PRPPPRPAPAASARARRLDPRPPPRPATAQTALPQSPAAGGGPFGEALPRVSGQPGPRSGGDAAGGAARSEC